MAQRITEDLESAERKWRDNSKEWKNKLKAYDLWQARQEKVSKRARDKADTSKKDSRETQETAYVGWEQTFDPEAPSEEFSFADIHAYSKAELEKDIEELQPAWRPSRTVPVWAIDALRRGIAVHHAGMNKRYRTLIER